MLIGHSIWNGRAFSPHGIMFVTGTVKIDILWSLGSPMIIAIGFGWQYGLLAGVCGGALFPFLLWAEDGWANVTTAVAYLLLFALLGIANDTRYFKRFEMHSFRIAIAIAVLA
jgi:hypothetical protein